MPTIPDPVAKLSTGRWFKRAGDAVTLDEPLVETNTNNVTQEIRAPVTGVSSDIQFGAALYSVGVMAPSPAAEIAPAKTILGTANPTRLDVHTGVKALEPANAAGG